jgi:hypothetical protein
MPAEDDRPAVIPSELDPDIECVRIDEPSDLAQPPGPPVAADGPKLCPDGYLPRRRSRGGYQLEGKRIVTDASPIRNPDYPVT